MAARRQVVAELLVDAFSWSVEEHVHRIPLAAECRMVPRRRFAAGLVIAAIIGSAGAQLFIRVPGLRLGSGFAAADFAVGGERYESCVLGPTMCSCACKPWLTYEHHRAFCKSLVTPLREPAGFVLVTRNGTDTAAASAVVAAVVGNATLNACLPLIGGGSLK